MKLVPGSPNLPITTLVVVEPVHAAGCFVIGWQVGGTPQQPMMSEWWW